MQVIGRRVIGSSGSLKKVDNSKYIKKASDL